MQISYDEIQTIESAYCSPFYLFDQAEFEGNYAKIVEAFTHRYDKFILGYSYKTNYIPYLCGIIKDKGGYAEVVSRMEYDLAIKVGQEPNRIIFNGPVKHYEDIELALTSGSMLNIDSWYEVDFVKQFAQQHPKQDVRIGLRINIGLSDQAGQSHIQDSLRVGRFGFSPDGANLSRLFASLAESPNVVVNALHGHTSTTDRSQWCYEVITRTLCDIASKYAPDTIEYINVGGGIFGYIPPENRWCDVPSFDDYAEVIARVLSESSWARQHQPSLILEPGIAVVANTLSFVTKVISTKEIKDKYFVTVDGSAFNTKPTFHKINQPYDIIKKNANRGQSTYSVVGSTCMEKDYLLTDITDTTLERDDYIMINNVGAYTVVLSPPFINVAPAIVAKTPQGTKIIRHKQCLDNVFCNYEFE